mmetsp:Transcript_9609/g.22787  ORF Transcript_9609/g.22787 Transcript_9609/m.22787 type:complete len:490 (+) Transcript_9609:651-2120(+)
MDRLVRAFLLLFDQGAELPDAPPPPRLRIHLLHHHHVRQAQVWPLLGIGFVVHRRCQVVAHHGIPSLDEVPHMRDGPELDVIGPEVPRPRERQLRLLHLARREPRKLRVDHDVLGELLARHQNRARVLVVQLRPQLAAFHRQRVQQLQTLRHARAHRKRSQISERAVLSRVQADQVVLADRDNLDRERVLGADFVVVEILRDHLLALHFLPARHHAQDEVLELQRVRPVQEVEVNTIWNLLDVDRLLVRFILEDELLEEVESTLVVHLLPHLDDSAPGALRGNHVAVCALEVMDHHLNHEHLLQNHAAVNLLLDRQLQFQTPRMRLRPDERRVDELHFVQALDALQTNLQQLLALRLACHPQLRGVEVSSTCAAVLHWDRFGNAFGDVNPRSDAVCAHRCRVPHHRRTAVATHYCCLSPRNQALGIGVGIGHRHHGRDICWILHSAGSSARKWSLLIEVLDAGNCRKKSQKKRAKKSARANCEACDPGR